MSWTDRTSILCAVILYGVSAVYSIFLFRKGFRQDNRLNYLLLLAAFGFNTLGMVQRGFALNRCPIHNLFEATLFVEWAMLATYLVIGLWARLRFLGAFASPVLFAIGVFALMPQLDAPEAKFEISRGWISLHAALFALAYGAFGLSSVAGMMYLMQEHDLKFHKFRAVFSLMPPIQRLEMAAGRLLLAGFILLTLAMASSTVLARHAQQLTDTRLAGDTKTLWSLFVWALYLALVLMRWKFAQGGRRFAWGTIASFVFVLLTFWGSSLLSTFHRP